MAEVFCLLLVLGVFAVLLTGFPVAFALSGTSLFFAAIGTYFGVFDNTWLMNVGSRIFGNIMVNDTLVAVPLFVFMGVILERSKIAERLLDTMAALFMGLRGGLALSVIFVGLVLGASTGIVGATVVTMGLISLPTMLRHGYDARIATGTICASGTLGQIIPPSIVLVLLGGILSNEYANAQTMMGVFAPDAISVGDLFIGAIIPGLLLVIIYAIYVMLVAWFKPQWLPATPALANTHWLEVVSALIPPLVLIVAVLGSIMFGVATSTESAAVGAVGAMFLAELYRMQEARLRSIVILTAVLSAAFWVAVATLYWLGVVEGQMVTWLRVGVVEAVVLILTTVFYRPDWARLRYVMQTTTRVSSMVFVILIGATIFSATFRGFRGDEIVHRMLTDLPGGAASAMTLVMAVTFFLGFFLDFFEIVFVVVPIVATPLLMLGLDPIWLGVMFAVNLQTSFLTPPFGFSLFYLRGVAPAGVTTMQIYQGIVPFVFLQLLVLILLAAWPELATWLPRVVFPD